MHFTTIKTIIIPSVTSSKTPTMSSTVQLAIESLKKEQFVGGATCVSSLLVCIAREHLKNQKFSMMKALLLAENIVDGSDQLRPVERSWLATKKSDRVETQARGDPKPPHLLAVEKVPSAIEIEMINGNVQHKSGVRDMVQIGMVVVRRLHHGEIIAKSGTIFVYTGVLKTQIFARGDSEP